MKHQKLSPADGSAQLLALAGGLWVSRALWVAARLRIADHIDNIPVSVAELAGASDTQPDALHRILVALASIGVFRIGDGGCFAHTPLSELLRSDHPASQRAFIESVFGHEHYAAWGAIEGAVRTGTPGFDLHYGEASFDWFSDNPDAAVLFGEAMTGATGQWRTPFLRRMISATSRWGSMSAAVTAP